MISNRNPLGWLALVLAFFSTACVTQRTHRAATPVQKYYGVELNIQRGFQDEGTAEKSQALVGDAGIILRSAGKVAFFPPDSCVTTTAAPEGAEQSNFIQMNCGVLMSTLERTVAAAGYEVVSWQFLRSAAATGNPIEQARQLGVDILFEVDQLSVNERERGVVRATGLDFFEQGSESDRTPVRVKPEVGERCKEIADMIVEKLNSEEASATLAAKAVNVNSGSALWYYQRTRLEDGNDQKEISYRMYWDGTPEPTTVPVRSTFNSSQKFGAIVTTIFATLTSISLLAGAASGQPDGVYVGIGGAAVSSIFVVIGAFSLGEGNKQAREWNQQRFNPLPVLAEDVLCSDEEPVRPPFDPDAIAPREKQEEAKPLASSSFTFEDKRRGDQDESRRRTERLFDAIAKDFVKAIREF